MSNLELPATVTLSFSHQRLSRNRRESFQMARYSSGLRFNQAVAEAWFLVSGFWLRFEGKVKHAASGTAFRYKFAAVASNDLGSIEREIHCAWLAFRCTCTETAWAAEALALRTVSFVLLKAGSLAIMHSSRVMTARSYAGDRMDRLSEVSIIRHSSEGYFATETGRSVVVGRHGRKLVMIPYETKRDAIVPVTLHATTRHQITFRLRTARFIHE